MSRKFFVTITIILSLFLISLVVYYFLTKDTTTGPDGTRSGFNFFPFGNSGEEKEGTNSNENLGNEGENGSVALTPPQQTENFTKRLRKISVEPVSGMGVFDGRAGTIVRYIEKATGHIYEVELFSPKVARISNTTIPLSYDALWGNRSDSFVARYLEDDNKKISSYSLVIKSTSTTTANTTSGTVLPENITDVSVFGDRIFYVVEDLVSSEGFISNFENTSKKQIWASEIKEFNSQFVNNRTVALTTRPHHGVNGYLYFVDTENGSVRKILGDVKGLTAIVNSDLSKVVYTELDAGIAMKVFNNSDKSHNILSPETFPEKCVWSKRVREKILCGVSKSSLYADSLISWYKGLNSFDDVIYSYNSNTISIEKIIDLSQESGEKIDVIKPILSENEQYLVFMNKIDNSLWSLDLTKTATSTASSSQ